MTTQVLHVVRAFSAQPTLGNALGADVEVREEPLAEALVRRRQPDVVWVSSAGADDVHALHRRFPDAALLATLDPGASPDAVVLALAHGADLVLRDAGVLLAAAGIAALARRRRPVPAPAPASP